MFRVERHGAQKTIAMPSEKELYDLALSKNLILFTEYQDTDVLIDLALRIGVKMCLKTIVDPDTAARDVTTATRLLAQIRYKLLDEEDDSGGKDVTSGMREKDIETIKGVLQRSKK